MEIKNYIFNEYLEKYMLQIYSAKNHSVMTEITQLMNEYLEYWII